MKAQRILIVDDHRLFAETIGATLRELGHEVVGIAQTSATAVTSAAELQPDVVLMDLQLPDGSGLDAGREILERSADVRILAVTAIANRRTAGEALRLGFHGYLTKDAPISRFIRAIDSVADGQVSVPQGLTASYRGTGAGSDDEGVRLRAEQLTPRELDVLALMVAGVDGRGIARQLNISTNTVRTHAQSILTKLQVHSRLEAATFAVRHGIVPPPGVTSRSA